MSGGIYLIRDDGGLVEMTEQAYATEDLLQKLLADYPNLLAGDQMSSGEPRRWLLISRELGVPAEEDGGDRWSVDHLFLDQDAIPTIVEVKRSTDTRIRREVVGQMIDYAANAVVYWPVERLRARFEESYEEPEQQLIGLLEEPDAEPDDFWQKVKTNLQAGRVRLVFVADKMPTELRRVVEFLNLQMDPAEVLAVEIKQYMGGGMKTLVPRVIGQTEEAQQKKSGGAGGSDRSDEETFYKKLAASQGNDEVAVVREIQEWARQDKLPRFEWRSTGRRETFEPCLDHKGPRFPLKFGADGKVAVTFGWLSSPFGDEKKRKELLQRLNEIPHIDISADRINGHPTFPLSALNDEAALKDFLEVFDWFVHEVKAT
ncbi:hypothetical protein BH23ACT11_BH23ACT11_26790 [soil metagenome]